MKPFVKWAGGKTQLLQNIREVIPEKYDTYYEPFLGGGAVLFDLKPQKAIVSDINPQLINAYLTIRNSVNELMDTIDCIDRENEITSELYYNVRERFNEQIKEGVTDIENAALLIWLNHHCFNGLYRTNREGCFNTPWNRSTRFQKVYERENLLSISEYLQEADVSIICDDYKNVITQPKMGDFVFIDPPYDSVGEYGDFKRYAKEQFYEKDQIKLSDYIHRLSDRKVFFCLTNSNTTLINNLYQGYRKMVIKTHRNINSKGKKRFGEDAIITPR